MFDTLRALSGVCVLSVGVMSLFTTPASAFTFSGNRVTIDATDAGNSFQVVFDGSVRRTPVPSLSALATVTFLGFQASGNFTLANLKIDLVNTASEGITSRISAFAFNTAPNVVSAISGGQLFPNVVLDGRLPNGFGDVEVCFTGGNTCQGGRNSGVTTGNSGTFFPTLAFRNPVVDPTTRPVTRQPVTSFTLLNFGVRYQSVDGVSQGTSGTGQGTPRPTPTSVPEPGVIGALALASLVALRYRKHSKTDERSLAVSKQFV
jgi:hypothetical protein